MVWLGSTQARRYGIALVTCALAALTWTFGFAADATYGYDEGGRLVQIQTPSGSAQYRYDVAGNLTSVQRPGASTVAIADFMPNAGPAGTQVTIIGSGFSATPASNIVRFNGTAASVITATTSRLTVAAPATATSGAISVTVATNSAISNEDFTFTSAALHASPTITGMSAGLVKPGDSITLSGTGFVGTGADLWVAVNGILTTITSATETQITFVVPSGATSGLVTVGTKFGMGTSPTPLFIPPLGSTAANIATTGSVSVDGEPLIATIPAGYLGLFAVTGVSGQSLGLGVSPLISTPSGRGASFQLFRPNGALQFACNLSAGGGACNLPSPLNTGTYSLLVVPDGGTAASFNLTLSRDVTGVLVPNGPAQNFGTLRIGQNARYTFDGTAGQNMSVLWTGATFPGLWSYLRIYQPSGTEWTTASFSGESGYGSATGTRDFQLPVTGKYAILVDPYWAATGQVSLSLLANNIAPLAPDGPSVTTSLASGQNGDYTFYGSAGQRLGLGISSVTTTPAGGGVGIQVLRPDRTVLTDCGSFDSSGKCNLAMIPLTGEYIVRVNPTGTVAANVTLTLSTEITGSLMPGGAGTTFSTTRIGQNGRYSFSANAGQSLSLLWSGVAIPGSRLVAYRSDGSQLASTNISPSNPIGTLDLVNLAAGDYAILVEPVGTSTGQVTLSLLTNALGTLEVDGAPLSVALNPGQNGDYVFSGTAGQRLGLGVGPMSTNPSGGNVTIEILRPDRTSLTYCSSFVAPGGSCNLTSLPSAGQYTVRVNPQGMVAANLTMTLSNDATGTLVPNATGVTFSTNRIGQNARYTFNGTAGQNMSLLWSDATFPSVWSRLYVYRPDGISLVAADFTGDPNYGGAYASGSIDLLNLPNSGTYTVFVDPSRTDIGQITVSLLADASTALSVDGPPTSVVLTAGQNGSFVFTGAAGQRLGLGISALNTGPSEGTVAITVLRPDRSLLKDCFSYMSPGGSCDLPSLPMDGQYTVRVEPAAFPGPHVHATASLTLTLSNDAAGTLVPNGPGLTFVTSRVGQNARYVFNAAAGQNFSLMWSNATFPGAWTTMVVYRPDGSEFTRAEFSGDAGLGRTSGTLDLPSLPASGTYTVFVDPYDMSTGQVQISLNGPPDSGGGGEQGDVPLPLWAVVMLGAALLGGGHRALQRRPRDANDS